QGDADEPGGGVSMFASPQAGRSRFIARDPAPARTFAMSRPIVAAVAMLAFGLAAAAPDDAKHRYMGSWRIEKSEPAPWAKPADMIEKDEVKRLTGADVQFSPDRIDGPKPIACKGPNYELKQYPAEGLFQGALEEYGDPSTTPDAMAAKLG